jgi:NAD(P)-dependent dehydrogenase (short-subunit alcohol dehydrogenase family)
MRFKDKIVIVTGGATGIGRAASVLFAGEGAQVIVADINPEKGQETLAIIRDNGGQASFFQLDVSDESQIMALTQKTDESFGGVDVLFNNAGIGLSKTATDTTSAEWDKLLGINLKACFLFCKYTIPLMQKRGGGSIVINASANGVMAEPGIAAYCASKGGLIALTRSLALDYAKYNIRVNCINAGYIDTPINTEFFATPGSWEFAAKLHPIGRVGQPEEVAKAALFLASDDASFITGTSLAVDGGLTAAIGGAVL